MLLVLSSTSMATGMAGTSAFPAPVPAPPTITDAASVLGLSNADAQTDCMTFDLPPHVLDAWFGAGESGVLSTAERNGEAVSPALLAAFLEEHAAQGAAWANHALWLQENCDGKFAFCLVHHSGVAGLFGRTVYCATCCEEREGTPYGACDFAHYVAVCGCEEPS